MNFFEEIKKYSPIRGKKVIVGLSGGIAAYKAVELVRALQKAGATVQVVMTKMATKFVGEETFYALTGEKVLTEVEGMDHIWVTHSANLFVVAPATANIIGKFANGICDTMLTTMLIAATCPIVIVPSMNWAMLKHPATQENIAKLRSRGYIVVEPDEGDLACGESGEGKFPSIEKIFYYCENALYDKNLEGKKAVVTAGPTKEFIDDIRFLSNPSSGFMGYLIARELALEGADVCLITGGDTFDAEIFCKLKKVTTSDDMFNAVMEEIEKSNPDIFVGAAAVSDFKPAQKFHGKIKKEEIETEGIKIELLKTKDIISAVSRSGKKMIIVGFALESNEIEKNMIEKMRAKKMDIIVGNTPSSMSKEDGEFFITSDKQGSIEKLGRMHKREVARKIIEKIRKIIESGVYLHSRDRN